MKSSITIFRSSILVLLICATAHAYAQGIYTIQGIQNGIMGKNKMYSSYYNELIVSSSGNDTLVDLSSPKGDVDILKKSATVYLIRAKGLNKTRILRYLYASGESGITNIEVDRDIPNPVLDFAGTKRGGVANATYKFDSLSCKSYYRDRYNAQIRYRVRSFILELKIKGALVYRAYCASNRIPKSFIEAHKKAHFKEDHIYLKNVVVEDDIGNVIVIDEKRLTVGM